MHDPLRHHRKIDSSAFGNDTFGRAAEGFARFFGTPRFIVGQTVVVTAWIIVNAVGIGVLHWDPYPFILLNLVFSTQAAYAAPLILLAQTRQADRDRHTAEADSRHREELAKQQREALNANTELTEEVHSLATEIHIAVVGRTGEAQR